MQRRDPWITDNEVDLQLDNAIPRPTIAWDAVLDILTANLPRQAARKKLPVPGAIAYYGTDVSKQKPPYILLSSSPTTEEQGVGYHEMHNLVLSCVYMPQVNAVPIRQCSDLLTLVSGILSVPRLAGNYYGPEGEGPLLWVRLQPRGGGFVPPNWPDYSGVIGHWLLQQPPSAGAWA